MLSHGTFFAKYGVQTTFYFALEDATVTDAPFTGVAPVAADIFLSKDGGAPAAATNAATAIGNGIYSWVATATELQATRLAVSIYDQTATEIFKPVFFVVQTKMQLGQIDVDATQIGGNAGAINAQGVGTGAGIQGTGGATGNGIQGVGGATSGNGIQGTAAAGTSHGIGAVGVNGGSGIVAAAGATGNGILATGGATSGAAANFAAQAGNSNGITVTGTGSGNGLNVSGGATGNGFNATGGATSGHGIVGTAPLVGAGIYGLGASSAGSTWAGILGTCPVDAGAGGLGIAGSGTGSGDGARFTGGATGDGIQTSGGATSGHGINAITQAGNSHGIRAEGRGTGNGLSVAHASDNSLMTNIFDNLEGTEPSGAIANNASFKQIWQYLKRRFTNLVTQTATTQTWYKDDSVTVLTTEACSNDGTTQSKGKSS